MEITQASKAVPKDHPARRQIMQYEADMAAALWPALAALGREVVRGINADNVQELTRRAGDMALWQGVRDVIVAWLRTVAEDGADFGKLSIEQSFFGVKRLEMVTDWELANEEAAQWAVRFGTELTGLLAQRTTPRIQALVADWIRNGEPLKLLIERIQDGRLYSYDRANEIAVTEVTRAFAAGNEEAWRASGVVQQKQWNTAVDELVCPYCGPLNGMIVGLDERFNGIDRPPAHPRCRCWITPVVNTSQPTLTRQGREFTTADEIAFLEQSGFDPFAAIRPPTGRAPRGMGEEYRARRRIVSRISTQMRWRGIAERELSRYRGTNADRWEMSVRQDRVNELSKGISAMLEIASQPEGDWGFKMELVDGIIGHIQALTGMTR